MFQLPTGPDLSLWKRVDCARIVQSYLLRGKPRIARAYALFCQVVGPTAERLGCTASGWAVFDYDYSAHCTIERGEAKAKTILLLTADFWQGAWTVVDLLDLPEAEQIPVLTKRVETICRALENDAEAYGG
jgi:hypothetical protein